MIKMLEIIYPIALSAEYAVSMKIADNLHEHGLKLFKGSNIVFGVLCGAFGSLIIVSNRVLAAVWLAILIGWVLRSKIDCINHGIAGSIMFITLIFNMNTLNLNTMLFLIFFVGMALIGFIHDYLTKKQLVTEITSELFHTISFYILLPLIVSITSEEWVIFGSMLSFVIAYEITRQLAK